MKRAASAGPQRLSEKRSDLGKTLREPVPNTAVNYLIGTELSKTILSKPLTAWLRTANVSPSIALAAAEACTRAEVSPLRQGETSAKESVRQI
jgi:hypothetical protein